MTKNKTHLQKAIDALNAEIQRCYHNARFERGASYWSIKYELLMGGDGESMQHTQEYLDDRVQIALDNLDQEWEGKLGKIIQIGRMGATLIPVDYVNDQDKIMIFEYDDFDGTVHDLHKVKAETEYLKEFNDYVIEWCSHANIEAIFKDAYDEKLKNCKMNYLE